MIQTHLNAIADQFKASQEQALPINLVEAVTSLTQATQELANAVEKIGAALTAAGIVAAEAPAVAG